MQAFTAHAGSALEHARVARAAAMHIFPFWLPLLLARAEHIEAPMRTSFACRSCPGRCWRRRGRQRRQLVAARARADRVQREDERQGSETRKGCGGQRSSSLLVCFVGSTRPSRTPLGGGGGPPRRAFAEQPHAAGAAALSSGQRMHVVLLAGRERQPCNEHSVADGVRNRGPRGTRGAVPTVRTGSPEGPQSQMRRRRHPYRWMLLRQRSLPRFVISERCWNALAGRFEASHPELGVADSQHAHGGTAAVIPTVESTDRVRRGRQGEEVHVDLRRVDHGHPRPEEEVLPQHLRRLRRAVDESGPSRRGRTRSTCRR